MSKILSTLNSLNIQARLIACIVLLTMPLMSSLSVAHPIVVPPERVVAIHQSAIENMLRLDLQEHLVGVAYIDDELPPLLANKLYGVPHVAKALPSREQLLSLKADLIYAGFPSAFTPSTLGNIAWWQSKGSQVVINPYSKRSSNNPIKWSDAWQDLHELAQIFHVTERAKRLENAAKQRLPLPTASTKPKPKVLLIDAYSLQANIGACCGGADLMIRLAGGHNVGNALKGRWSKVSWEKVAQMNPDIIIIATYQHGPTDVIINKLNQHPLLSRINAVQNQGILLLPFTETIASPRLIEGIIKLHSLIDKA